MAEVRKIDRHIIKQEDKTKNNSEEILKIATKLFYENGYDNTPTRELAKAVGMSNAGIYYHYKDKNDILFHILNESTSRLYKTVRDAVIEEDDPIENLDRIISTLVKVVVESKIEIGILLKESNRLSSEQLKSIKSKMKAVVELTKNELAKLDNKGQLKKFNVTVSAFALMGMTNWVMHWYDPSSDIKAEELADTLKEIFFSGVIEKV
jgi:TetR/AcrR family transcriptional regulator, cholesterol catabolism regulator